MKLLSLYNQILNESVNLISAEQLQKIQCIGNPSCDVIFGMTPNDQFQLINIKLSDVNAPRGLSLAFYKRKGLDEDVFIVNRLIKALQNNEKITPFVIDRDNKIMDGLHRYVAFKEYYGLNSITKVYKQINNEITKPNSISLNRFLYHKSNIKYRDIINKEGLIPQRGVQWMSDTDIKGNAIFATNSENKNDWFDSTWDDDVWQIDITKIPNIKWLQDPNFSWSKNYKHVYTQQSIPREAIKLIYNGSGKDML